MNQNLIHVIHTLWKVGQTNSLPTKAQILEDHDSPLLREVLLYALSPKLIYGIKKIPKYKPSNKDEGCGINVFFMILNSFANKKVTGNAAIERVKEVLTYADPELVEGEWSEALLYQRILLKDLRIGLQAKTVNKAFKDLIPKHEVMKAHDWADYKHKVQYPLIAEVKWDGKRIIPHLDNGKLDAFLSRNGIEEPNFEHIKQQFEILGKHIKGYVIPDGELMWGMFGDRSKDAHTKNFVVFDLLTIDEWSGRVPSVPQEQRTERIDKLFKYAKSIGLKIPNLVPTTWRWVHNEEEVEAFYEEVVNAGGEGIMLKDPRAVYERKRSKYWLKLKPEKEVDLEIISIYEGEPDGQFVGSLGGFVVIFNGKPQRVGGGMTHEFRDANWKNQGADLIGYTATIKYTELTPEGNFRFARLKEIRDDK